MCNLNINDRFCSVKHLCKQRLTYWPHWKCREQTLAKYIPQTQKGTEMTGLNSVPLKYRTRGLKEVRWSAPDLYYVLCMCFVQFCMLEDCYPKKYVKVVACLLLIYWGQGERIPLLHGELYMQMTAQISQVWAVPPCYFGKKLPAWLPVASQIQREIF